MDVSRRDFVGLTAGAAAGFAWARPVQAAVPAEKAARWYRGMIHAHTCWSDGRALPEQAVAAYKNGGYDFFSITDHNCIGEKTDRWMKVAPLSKGWPPKTIEPSVFESFKAAFPDVKRRMKNGIAEVRVSPMAEIAARFNEPGRFLVMPGCEVTTAIVGTDRVRRDLHMNYVGLDGVIPRARKAGLIEWIDGRRPEDVLRETKDQVDALAAEKGCPGHVFFVNHPHWRYYDVLPEVFLANPDVRFFELCNGVASWPVEDGMPRDGFDNDRLWDVVNAVRCRRGEPLLYAVATEDSHWYPNSGSSHPDIVFGDAWIGVRASALTPAALFTAMDKGDFYAACGFDLEDVAFDRDRGVLSVAVPAKPGVSHTVKFITTKRGANVNPIKIVTLPAKGDRPLRRVPVYSDEVGAVVKTVSFGKGEAVRASCVLQEDDLYIRARVESDEPVVNRKSDGRMHPSTRTVWTQPYRRETVETWPLVTIRHTPGVNENPDVFRTLLDSHRRHPGACDEFWLCDASRQTIPDLEKSCRKIAALREQCAALGIAAGFQQGLTLGHGEAHDGKAKPGEQAFPDDAWQVGRDGRRIPHLCPRSPDVLAYQHDYVRTVLKVARPVSYWLDDDLRLGVWKAQGCFCDRCLAAFNAKTGGRWTRETLAARLFSKKVREPLRSQWADFNAASLAVYAAEARRAADMSGDPCRLAYQAVWSDTWYTASDYRLLLEALSGKARHSVGIRPGAGFWTEESPRGMVSKCLSAAREAERCRGYGFVESVCYEMETYPRHVLHKSPGAIMTECALALASGCNALSLYWYAVEAPEPLSEYDHFVETLARARPYFERLSASTRRTRLGGVARFVGSGACETPWFDLRDQTDFNLACAGIPVTVAESGTKVWYLTGRSRSEMTAADDARLASGGVVEVGDIGKFPLARRRAKLLDDLDAVTGGAFPVRIDACRALRVLPRVRADGKVDSVTVLNLSIGAAEGLEIRVRNAQSASPVFQAADGRAPVPLACRVSPAARECVVTLPDLSAWQIATIFF